MSARQEVQNKYPLAAWQSQKALTFVAKSHSPSVLCQQGPIASEQEHLPGNSITLIS